MQFSLKEVVNGAEEVAQAHVDAIRLFNASLNFSNTQLDNVGGTWVECTPQTAENFSAIAYFFSRELHNRLNVPVGAIFPE